MFLAHRFSYICFTSYLAFVVGYPVYLTFQTKVAFCFVTQGWNISYYSPVLLGPEKKNPTMILVMCLWHLKNLRRYRN